MRTKSNAVWGGIEEIDLRDAVNSGVITDEKIQMEDDACYPVSFYDTHQFAWIFKALKADYKNLTTKNVRRLSLFDT